MNPYVIITAPHAQCNNNNPIRNCDILAKNAANILYSYIKCQKCLLIGNRYRSDIDLNRPVSRQTDFRLKLTSTITNIMKDNYRPIFLLDVHSFPTEIYGNYEVIILDNTKYPDSNNTYTYRLCSILHEAGIICTKYQGIPQNDIVAEGNYYHLLAPLIEFHETLTIPRVHYICTIISQWINTELNHHLSRLNDLNY